MPRYPTLPNIMKAKKKEIVVVAVAALLQEEESLTATASFHPPAKKGGGIVLEGETGELVDRVIALLKEKTAVLR